MATDSLDGLPPGFELEEGGSGGLPAGFEFESQPTTAELPAGFEIEAPGAAQPVKTAQPDPVADRKVINGREYRKGQESGLVFDDKNKIVDDPAIKEAFGIPADPGAMDYASEFGRSTVRGAAGTTAAIGRGISVLTSDDSGEILKVEKGIANLKTMSPEDATAFLQGLPQRLSPAVAFNYQMAIRKLWNGDEEGAKPYLDQARKYTDTRLVEDQPLTKAADRLEKSANEAFPQDPRFKGSITSDVGQGLGSTAVFLPIGLLTGGTGVALTGAAAGADQTYQDARKDIGTSTREDRAGLYNAGLGTEAAVKALQAGRMGALPGASEVVPIETFLEQAPKLIPGLRTFANTPIWGRFAKAFGRIGTQVLAEGGQEAFQTWASNVINRITVDPSQVESEDVLYNAMIGGAVGGGMQTAVEGYNAVLGKDEPAPAPRAPGTPGAPPPPAGGPRIEPRLFPDDPGAMPPGFDIETPEAPVSDDAYLVGAGYTLEQISDMNPEERAAAAEEARQQGVEPVDLMAGAPAPGTAPMAPRASAAPGEAASDPTAEINMPPPPGTAPMAPRGTRRDKVSVETEQDLEAVRPTVNAEPSEAQAQAGNYQKGHIKIHGLDVAIENPRGSVRRGRDEDGKEWASPELPADYGYIKRTTGKDGDHVDVYIGPNPKADTVYVIDQINLNTGKFDEHKSVLGASSLGEAVDLYVNSFTNPTLDRIGDVTEMSIDEFRQWVKDGKNTKRPAAKAGVGTVTPNLPEPPQAPADNFDSIFREELDAEFGPAAPPAVDTAAIDTALSKYVGGRKPLTAQAFAQVAGIEEAEAGRALQRAALAGRIMQGRNGQWRRNPTRSTPINALDFIASIGGISDPTGELAGMDLPKMTPFGPVVRKTGLHPDAVRERLIEAGYLQDRGWGTDRQQETTVADVYDLIDRHMGGKKVYSVQDQTKADDIEATRRAETLTPDDWELTHPVAQRWGEDVWNQIQEALADMGLDEDAWSPQEVNDAARMVAAGMDAGAAFERAAIRHIEELDEIEEVAPEIAAAFEKNRANAMVAMEVPPFPDVEPQTDAVQQQGSPEARDGLRPDGEGREEPGGEAEVSGPAAEVRGAGEARAEAGSPEPADDEGVSRPRRNAIGSTALEDALSPEAQSKLAAYFKRRNASRDLRYIREAMEIYQRAIDGGFEAEADAVRSAMEVFLEDQSEDSAMELQARTWEGLQAITGEEDPDPAELLENEVFASAQEAGELVFQTLDPKTASFDVEEFNAAFGEVEFRRDQEKVFPPVKKQVRIWKDTGLNRIPQDEADARIAEWKTHARRIGETEDHSNEVILSLFDVTGQWSQPYRDAGYKVIQYDIKSGNDLMKFGDWMMDVEEQLAEGREIVGILAAPPCTTYASSGARWWSEIHDKKDKAAIEKTFGEVWAADFFETPVDYANALVAVVKLIVEQANPSFYAMENPVGRIQKQNQLPDALLSFDPTNFGNPYTKRTLLWGEFNTELPTANVVPTLGSLIHKLRGDDPKQKAQRSETPEGFAYAFFVANNTSELKLGEVKPASSESVDGRDTPEVAVAGEDDWLHSSNENGVFAGAEPVRIVSEKAGSAQFTINVIEVRPGKFTTSHDYELQGQSGGTSPATTNEVSLFDSPEQAIAKAANSIIPQFEYDFRDKSLPASKKRDVKKIILKLKELGARSEEEVVEPAPTVEQGPDRKDQLVIPGAEQDRKGALQNAAKAPLKASAPQKGMDVGLFGSERDQTDMFDKPAPKAATGAEKRLAEIKEKFVIFSSGMSRLKDFLSGAYAIGTLNTRGIGIDVNETSTANVKLMAKKIVDFQARVFIDSGAFGIFKRNLKERQRYEAEISDLFKKEGATAPKLEQMSASQLLKRYDAIDYELMEAAEAEAEASYPQPLYVAPDIVGDQRGSIDLVQDHGNWIKNALEGRREIIIPIQKGEVTLAEAFEEIAQILGRRDFIVGVPSNQKAVSDQEFAEFVAAAKPPKIHFLGTTDETKLEPRLRAIAEAGYVPDHVSSDANMLRALLYGRSDVVETRDEGIRRVLKERSPEFEELAGGTEESFDDILKDELDAAFEEKPVAEPDGEAWWNSLTGTGRRRVLEAAKVKRPDRVEWRYLDKSVQDRLLANRKAAEDAPATPKANLQGNWWEPLMGGDTGERAPRKPKTAGQAAASAAKNAAMGMGEIVQGLEALFGNKNKLSSGFTFDEESYAKALPLFKAAVAHLGEAVSDMRQVVRALIKKFREAGMSREAIENMAPYLKRFGEELAAGKVALETETPVAKEEGAFHPIVTAFVDYLSQPDAAFETITEARKFAADRGFVAKPGTPEAKDLDEKLELAIVLTARILVAASKNRPVKTAYRRLVDLYQRQPNLGVRTSESMADQAYSTPAPLAYIASRLAGVADAKTVMEPTAGNGMLLIEADPKNATVNELNERRAAALKAQGFRPTRLDAATEKLRHAGYPVEVVIENPPFGAVKEADGSSKLFDVDGWSTTQIDHAIALNTLKSMADDGRAVLIVGSVKEGTDKSRSDSYNTKQKREFYWRLYQGYNVTDHFTVSGDLYKRQGAGWPVDVIVIEGRAKSARPLPAVELPKVYDTWESLEEKLDEIPVKSQPAAGTNVGGGAVSQPSDVRDVAEDGERLEGGSRGDQSPDGGRGAAAVQPAADGQGGVPRGGDQRELAGAGEQQSAQPDGREVAPGERAERGGDRKPPVPERERVKQDAGAAQQPYKPMSSQPTLDTKIPTNMADAVETSLQGLADQHGQLDEWVEKELGYKKGEIGKFLAAEQVDAVALALDNVQKNAAFIIGDQTGIGKGRVVASALRYAMRKGLVPIFVTEKPNLYGDIIRDLTDIGVPQMLGRDLKPFLTNSGESIPLDDEAVAWYDEAQTAKAEGRPAPAKRGKFLRASGGDLHKRQMAALQKDGTGKDFDIIFTTYDQLNTVKGQTTDRRRLVDGLADRAFIVLDESHNAGGTEASERGSKNAPESRSDFLKKVTGRAKAVMFSSATYAKRPGVMALYARTDMGKAVEKPEMLGELISRGGVPMQQVVAAMLAKAGQYIRRERSFDGVSYDVEPVSVDLKAYEAVSTSLAAIARFDIELKRSDTMKEIKENLKESAEAVGMDSGSGEISINSTNFTSLMHNIVNQMLLSIKTDAVASRAIEALQAGEKPVITVANTMGAFLKSYAEDNELKRGDPVALSFRDVLDRYLERTRRLTIKRPDGTTYHYTIPLSALPGPMQQAYKEAQRLVTLIDTTNLPISPIDWLRFRLAKAGYRVSEITGRKEILEYSGADQASFSERLDSEVSPAGRRVNIDKFNRGDIDVMILNRAGSTGLSLHASAKFKDQRRRRMIIAQAELNIDVHMQMLGRVHRTGQVIPPAFVQAYADVPAEARPAAVLAKKMASLNANTTASRKSAFSADDSVDFLNEYGDQVAREFLKENPDINILLEVSLDTEKETARELTGRLLLLPVADQKRALDEITARYKVLIENLDAMGENALEAKTMDLEAKTLGRTELKPAEGDSPFTQAVILEETEVKSQGKALPLAEIIEKAAEGLGVRNTAEHPVNALGELHKAAAAARPVFAKKWTDDFERMAAEEIRVTKNEDVKAKRRETHAANRARFDQILDLVMPGARVMVKAKDGAALVGIVMNVSRRGQTGVTGNPLALGAWTAEIAIPDNAQRITVPFSSMALPGDTVGESERKVFIEAPDWASSYQNTVEAFEKARQTGKEIRYIVTGNILAGFDQTKGQGQIVNYTDDQGNVKPGILMAKTFSPKNFLNERAVRFKTAAQVTAFLKKLPAAEITSHDEIVAMRTNDSTYEIDMPAARQSGGTYFLNPDVRKAASDQFTKIGSRMRFRTRSEGEVIIVLDAMMKAGAVFQTTDQQDVAEEIVHGKKPEAPKQAPLSSRAQGRLSSRSADSTFATEFMTELAQVDELFRYPKVESASLERVLAGIDPDVEPRGNFMLSEGDRQNGAVRKRRFVNPDGYDFFVLEDGDGQVWIDISGFTAGQGGSAAYAAVANYAHNAGKVFIGDPAGLSDDALLRRTEAMLSSALKFGTTRHIEPHPRQLQGAPEIGIPPLKWTYGDDFGNVASLIEASTSNTLKAVPELADARYDFSSRAFRDAQGRALSDGAFDQWRVAARRAGTSRAGNTTLKRVVLLNSLLRAPSGARPGLLAQVLRQPGDLVRRGGLEGVLYDLPGRQKALQEFQPGGKNPYRFVISQKQTAQIVHDIGQIAERILGHKLARVNVVTDRQAWEEMFGDVEDAVFDPNTGVIYIALQGTQDPRATIRHEAIHALRQAGVITAREWAVLSRMATSRWIEQYKIRERYEALYRERFEISEAELEQLLIEEAVADAMAYHWGQPGGEDVVSRIFARVKQFLEAVRNALRGMGFTTASQILEGAEKGAMARRQPGTGQGRDFLLYARQASQGTLSSRASLRPPRRPGPGSFDAPHDERVRQALFDSTDTLLERIKRAGRAAGIETLRKLQDREIDLLRTQNAIQKASGPIGEPQNAYLAASLYPGRVAQRDKDFVADVVEPLVEDIARRGLTLDQVNDFVMARHAIERNLEVGQLHKPGTQFHEAMTNPDVVGASGLSENEAIAVLQGAVNAGKYDDLEAVGDKIVDMNRRTLAKLYAEGLVSKDQYDALTAKYQYYVPLRGWDDINDESHPDSPRTGRRYDVRGREFQQAFGRTSKSDSPLAYSILQARQAIIRIEKNRVGKRFLRLAQANPNPAFWEVNRVDLKKVIDKNTGYVRNVFDRGAAEAENVYAVKVGGKRYNVTLHHEGLLRAMKGIGGENMHGAFAFLHRITRFLAAVRTQYNPEFIFTNFFRDLQQAGIVLQEENVARITAKVVSSLPKAMAGMNRMLNDDLSTPWARYAREFADAGGKIGFMDRNDIEAEKRNLEALMRDANPSRGRKAWLTFMEHTIERVDRYNDVIENTMRLSAYVALRQAGASKDRAASVARELTVNFNRKGEWSPHMNALFMFFNASTQGGANFALRLYRSKKLRAIAAGLIAYGFVQSLLNRMLAGDDDDEENRWNKLSMTEKQRNHIIMLPKWLEDQFGVPYFKIPAPLSWNLPMIIGMQAEHAISGAISPLEAASNMVGAIGDAFNPLGSGGTFANTITPTLGDPIVDISQNRNFFGDEIVPRQFDETTPYAQRYNPSVSPEAKLLTNTLSELTGGSPERPGAIDWSPEWVEHIFDFALGGIGQMFSRTSTTVNTIASGEELDPAKVPFARVFVGRDSTFADRDEYFQIRDAVHITEKELKARLAEGDREAAARIRRDHAREVKMIEFMDAAEKRMRKLRKDYKSTKNALSMGEETRRKRLEALSKEMDEIELKVRTRWNRLEEGAR